MNPHDFFEPVTAADIEKHGPWEVCLTCGVGRTAQSLADGCVGWPLFMPKRDSEPTREAFTGTLEL